MLDKVSYSLNIALARQALTNAVAGFTGTQRNANTTRAGWGSFTIQDDDTPIQLLFKLDDLYLQGFRSKEGRVFLTKGSGYSITADKYLPYGNEYGDLGYDRTAAITITLDNLNGALAALYYAKLTTGPDTLKRSILYAAISISEAVRFDDVLMWIMNGKPITDLDWDKHKDQSKIRVRQV